MLIQHFHSSVHNGKQWYMMYTCTSTSTSSFWSTPLSYSIGYSRKAKFSTSSNIFIFRPLLLVKKIQCCGFWSQLNKKIRTTLPQSRQAAWNIQYIFTHVRCAWCTGQMEWEGRLHYRQCTQQFACPQTSGTWFGLPCFIIFRTEFSYLIVCFCLSH